MMEKTWRWFGKKDKITLPMLRQIGVEGIVTALHDIPNGEIWTIEAINACLLYTSINNLTKTSYLYSQFKKGVIWIYVQQT